MQRDTYDDKVRDATLTALLSGAATGGGFGAYHALASGGKKAKMAQMLKAGLVGSGIYGGLAGGSTYLGSKILGAPDGRVSTLWQCHSGDCLSIDTHVGEGEARPKADALVTDVAGLAIGVLTADCGPVLFTGRKESGAPVVGAAHAGWGGALGGVLDDTVSKMVQVGALPKTIVACVGPCIMQGSYEVGPDFAKPFILKHDEADRFFKAARKPGHMMFDLPGYIAFRLALAGVKTVRLMGLDTYAREADFFSFRRATHRGEPDYGREMSAIVIKG